MRALAKLLRGRVFDLSQPLSESTNASHVLSASSAGHISAATRPPTHRRVTSMSSPSATQIKTIASPTPVNLSAITSAPDTTIPTVEPTTNTPSLPPASLFTFLPDLYVLISRISELRNPPADLTSENLTQILTRESNASTVSGSLRPVNSAEGTVETKDLPGLVFGLKKRIAEARKVVDGLEDGEKTIEEQEREMEGLNRRIEGARERLGELAAICGDTRDVVMEGVGG